MEVLQFAAGAMAGAILTAAFNSYTSNTKEISRTLFTNPSRTSSTNNSTTYSSTKSSSTSTLKRNKDCKCSLCIGRYIKGKKLGEGAFGGGASSEGGGNVHAPGDEV